MTIDFGALFDQHPNPQMVVDREFRCVAVNRAFLRLVAREARDVVGRIVFEAFPNASSRADIVRASFERVFATGAVDEIAAIETTARTWTARHAPILDEHGRVSLLLQEIVEITVLESAVLDRATRIQSAATMLDLQLRDLREIFAQAPGLMCFLRGPEHVFEIVNDAFRHFVGHRDVVGMKVRDAMPEIVAQGFVDLLDHVYASGQPCVRNDVAVRLEQRDGDSRAAFVDFAYQAIRDRSGRVVGIFVEGQDITAQHAVERARQFLIDVMPHQVWTATPQGQLDFVSANAIAYFQRSSAQILGDGWISVLHPDDVDDVVARWTRSLTTGAPYEVEFRLRRADGSFRWHLGRANAERSGDGAVLRWVGTNTDIHDAKTVLAELTARSQYEERLIGIVSHDLRNPLSAISLAAALLNERPLDAASHGLVRRISGSAARSTRLINDLLDFAKARIGSGIPVYSSPNNLRKIVEHVVDEFDVSAPGRIVKIEHAGEEIGAWDADRLAQVLSNLVANALQHGAPGAPVYVESQLTATQAILAVTNDGPGIPAHELGRLFGPFQRSSTAVEARGSMGLGLFIAKEVIEAHGGTIAVVSAPGATTRFTVTLPRFARGDARSA
jgi:PAS domain S-box-containing protein